ncbi:MAG: type IV pilus assembly protein PilM, partial [Candidatus Vogelbacteria bacterium]|nr:type IV pilus assembly protein PilM [Candidatus Vogelbacteria bacterium]
FLNFKRFGFWKKKNNHVIGVDFGASSVKVIQLRKEKGRAILETYGEIATGPYRELAVGQTAVLTPDKQAELLRDLFREANITTNLGSIAIPLSASLVVIIEIPKVGKDLLAKVIPIEARKYIPVPISEVALDWWVIPNQQINPEAEEPKLEVLLVAIHNEVISQYRDLAVAALMEPAFFEIETFSAIRSVFAGDMAPTVILDIGGGSTKMAIVDYGIVRLSHTIGKGSQDITLAISRDLGVDFAKAEEIKRQVGLVERLEGENVSASVSGIIEYIFAEVNKVLATYQAKQRRAASRIILIGGGALLRGILDLATKSFEVPVSLGKPFDKVETPPFLQNVLAEAGPGFAVSIGLCLRHLQNLE